METALSKGLWYAYTLLAKRQPIHCANKKKFSFIIQNLGNAQMLFLNNNCNTFECQVYLYLVLCLLPILHTYTLRKATL